MAAASPTFLDELADIAGELRSCERRLLSLQDLAVYEELQVAVPNRLGNKARAVEVNATHLDELAAELAG